MEDLIVLVADQDAKLGIESLLNRAPSLGFRIVSGIVVRHPNRDNGVFRGAHDFLRPQSRNYRYAITLCDREGCGRERLRRDQIEAQIEGLLRVNGWDDRACSVVLDPELEAWLWDDWATLASLAGWTEGAASLRTWLVDRALLQQDQPKPARPKEAIERILRQSNKRASSSLFARMAEHADTTNCQDPAFAKLLTVLRQWFPV